MSCFSFKLGIKSNDACQKMFRVIGCVIWLLTNVHLALSYEYLSRGLDEVKINAV